MKVLEIIYQQGDEENIKRHLITGKDADINYNNIIKMILGENADLGILNHFLGDDYKTVEMSKKEKTLLLIAMGSVNEWVNPNHILEKYRTLYGEEIALSDIYTYLGRLHKENFLERKGQKGHLQYMLLKNNIPLAEKEFEKYL